MNPRLSKGMRLQWEPAQNAHVLLYPEGMVKLNTSAAQILLRCDGTRSTPVLIAELEEQFQASGLTTEVSAFLEMALAQRWIEPT